MKGKTKKEINDEFIIKTFGPLHYLVWKIEAFFGYKPMR